MTHSGHYNAIRQAKMLCEILVIGVCTSETVAKNKAPPIMSTEERMQMSKIFKNFKINLDNSWSL